MYSIIGVFWRMGNWFGGIKCGFEREVERINIKVLFIIDLIFMCKVYLCFVVRYLKFRNFNIYVLYGGKRNLGVLFKV